jgi:hypothetical protein
LKSAARSIVLDRFEPDGVEIEAGDRQPEKVDRGILSDQGERSDRVKIVSRQETRLGHRTRPCPATADG